MKNQNTKDRLLALGMTAAPIAIMVGVIFFQSNFLANADSLTVTGGSISMDVSTNGATFPSGTWDSNGKVGIGTASPAFNLTVVGDTKTDSVILKSGTGNNCYKIVVDDDGIENKTHVSCSNGSLIGHVVTANGDTEIDVGVSKFGGASGVFYKDSDNATSTDSADWDFGNGDFTVEGWVYATSTATNGYIASQGQGDLSFNVATYGGGSNMGAYFAFSYDGSNWAYANYTTTLSLNTWHHLALVRKGNVFTGYADGVGTTLATNPSAINNSAANLIIGGQGGATGASLYGNIDEVRITKGVARYTANFDASTLRPFSCQDSNTKLLLHMDSSTVFTDSAGC